MTEAPPLTPPSRPGDRRWVFDLVLMAVLLLGVAGVVLASFSTSAWFLSLLQILPLAVRRVRPSLSFGLVAGAMALQVFVNDVPIWGQVAMPIAVYSVAAYAPRRSARVAFAVALLAGIVGPVDWWLDQRQSSTFSQLLALFVVTELLVITPWAMGTLMRTRRAYVAELIDRGHRLEVDAARRAELAASDERARIAREMHDVIAHGLSVMIVQADGASYAVRKDPATAARALETISATGRESLAEMRRMLGLLRADDGSGTRPQPGLADLGYLLEQSTAAGMDLTSEVVTPLPGVPAGTGLTVYRVVQEGLTNARKHAGPGAAVHVAVTTGRDGRLHVTVSDDGRGPSGQPAGGHGLIGMRERVALHGGRLHTGPRTGGGFLLEAEIPLTEETG